jgi:hypothetical protein
VASPRRLIFEGPGACPTAPYGASSSLQDAPAKVPLLNPQPALSLDGKNRSSCPIAVVPYGPPSGSDGLKPVVPDLPGL